MAALVKYDEACAALAAARSVDEIKGIKNLAEQQTLYARQAKDRQLLADSVEIRDRAVRRLGQVIEAQKETEGLSKGGRPKTGGNNPPVITKPTLAEAGIDKDLAKQARAAAKLTDNRFEKAVAEKRAAIESRASKPLNPKPPKPRTQKPATTTIVRYETRVGDGRDWGEGPEGDSEEGAVVARRRGFLFRTSESVRYARFDDLIDLPIDDEMLLAVREVVSAWTETLTKMESIYEKEQAA